MSPTQTLNGIDCLRANLKAVLEHAAVLTRPCKRCGEMLYFVRGWNKVVTPFSVDGRNHYNHCAHLKKNAAQQEALFDAAPMPE